MAMTLDDPWPSLAPIRTSGAGFTLESHAPCESRNAEEGHSVESRPESVDLASSALPCAAHFNSSFESDQLTRQSSSSKTSSCFHFFTNCFSSAKTTTSPGRRHRRWHTPTCAMQGSSPSLRSMAFLFPAGGIQSFHSSPTTKVQLSGAFAKAQHYASPRTPGGASLNRQLSGEIQRFSSPRTPGSRAIHQYLSTPWTPTSGKVQHFSGVIPSPRTPFGSSAISPSSARQKKASFTLIMPPTMADIKKAGADQRPDEPTSPHVTCIGRVRRQTQCKKLLHTDMISPHAHRRHDTVAKKKEATTSKKPNSSTCRKISNKEVAKSSSELATMEACTQRFGRRKLHNLHKIHGFRDDADHGNLSFAADEGSLGSNQGEGGTLPIAMPVAYCREDPVHLASQIHDKHLSLNGAECMNEHMRSLQEAADDLPAKVRTNSSVNVECTVSRPHANVDGVADSTDTPVLHTTCNQLEKPDGLQHESHQAQCPKFGLPLSISSSPPPPPPRPTDSCLLLLRSTSRRR